MATLWMGDLEQYMDETFIKHAFSAMGEATVNVKIISNRMTGTVAGYCFVELADQTSADRCLHKLNGKPLPGSNPPKKFKLNYATYGKKPDAGCVLESILTCCITVLYGGANARDRKRQQKVVNSPSTIMDISLHSIEDL